MYNINILKKGGWIIMPIDSIISFFIAAIVVIILVKVVFKGTKSVFGFLINIAAGAFALWILNILQLDVPITWLTAGLVGLLGVPGVVVVVVLNYLFHII